MSSNEKAINKCKEQWQYLNNKKVEILRGYTQIIKGKWLFIIEYKEAFLGGYNLAIFDENGLIKGYVENMELCKKLDLYNNLESFLKSRGVTQ